MMSGGKGRSLVSIIFAKYQRHRVNRDATFLALLGFPDFFKIYFYLHSFQCSSKQFFKNEWINIYSVKP